MSYTDQEIAKAVEKLVRTSIRRGQGALGNRETGVTFNDYQDAAAGTFILHQNAPFYVVYAATRNLKKTLELEREALAEFVDAVEATDRRVTPISNLSPLANARVALDGMLLAAASRTKTFNSIGEVPAYQRFDSNTQQFLDESSKNIREDGEIVHTPGEARDLLAGYYRTLRGTHEDVIRRVELLEGAIADFNSLDLPASLIQAILENSRDSIQTWYIEFQKLTDVGRLRIIRAATLDILAARSTVKGFGSLTGATMFVPLDGVGGVFADANHPATPAAITSELGPYSVLEEATILHFDLEGDTVAIEVQGSFVAAHEGTVYAPYDIGKPNSLGVDNDEVRIQLLNYTSWGSVHTFDVDFDDGPGNWEAWNACLIINEVIYQLGVSDVDDYPLIAEPYANPLKFGGGVNIEWQLGIYAITSINPSTDFGALGIIEGAFIIFVDPTSSNQNAIFSVVAGGVGTTALECQLDFHPDGLSGAGVDETSKSVRITDDALPIRLRLTGAGDKAVHGTTGAPVHTAKPDYREAALLNKGGIAVPVSGPVDDDMQLYAATTLGFYPGAEVLSRRTTAEVIADNITASSAAAIDDVARIEAETYFEATAYSGRGRTDPFNFLQVVASLFEAKSVSVTDNGGSDYTFAATGAATAGVEIGHIVVVRASSDPDDIGLYAAITAVDDTQVRALFHPALQGSLVDMDIECGPDLQVTSSLWHDATAVVSGSPANDGDYIVLDSGPVPFELELDAPLPFPAGSANLPIYFDLGVGFKGVVCRSTDTTTATDILAHDNSSDPTSLWSKFFTSGTSHGVGSTLYYELPEWNKQLNKGDLLELYTVQFDDPTYSIAIDSLEESLLLLRLVTGLPTDTPQYSFTPDSPVPFGRIRNNRMNNYTELQSLLGTWLLLPANQDTYFKELLRLLNPLAANTNPSADQVGDAKNQFEVLDTAVVALDGYLGAYEADVVPQVDVLLQSLKEKGADRARDILLEAQFSTFFGMSMDETSYSGNVQARLKEISREDLPIRKDNRTGDNSGKDELLGQYEEPDYEYDLSDLDEAEELDIPAGSTY